MSKSILTWEVGHEWDRSTYIATHKDIVCVIYALREPKKETSFSFKKDGLQYSMNGSSRPIKREGNIQFYVNDTEKSVETIKQLAETFVNLVFNYYELNTENSDKLFETYTVLPYDVFAGIGSYTLSDVINDNTRHIFDKVFVDQLNCSRYILNIEVSFFKTEAYISYNFTNLKDEVLFKIFYEGEVIGDDYRKFIFNFNQPSYSFSDLDMLDKFCNNPEILREIYNYIASQFDSTQIIEYVKTISN